VVCERPVVEKQDVTACLGTFYGTSRHTLRSRNHGARHRPIPTLGMCRYQGSNKRKMVALCSNPDCRNKGANWVLQEKLRQRILIMDHLSVAPQASMVENRLEQGTHAGLAVQVSGRDCNGTPFTQRVTASNVSRSGALLSGLSRGMRSGDLLWVEYEQRKQLDRRAPHGTQ
jgi:hypothetical protein